jgi:hypothetical protein
MFTRFGALCLLAAQLAPAQQIVRARTEDGKTVELLPDGTWRYLLTSPAGVSEFRKPASATQSVKPSAGEFTFWYDPGRWRQSAAEAGRITFTNLVGTINASITTQSVGLSGEGIRLLTLRTTQNASPDATVVEQRTRIVNGRRLLSLRLEGTTRGIPFVYWGYAYGGSSGTIEVMTYVSRNLFEQSRAEMEEFLNGLEIGDEELPEGAGSTVSAATGQALSIAEGRFGLVVDPDKWRADRPDATGKITIEHIRGRSYAVVTTEASEIPLDNVPEVVLATARIGDPRARLALQERRVIDGKAVIAVKILASVRGVPVTIYSYTYTGPSGTIQVATYTEAAQFDSYEADLKELLDGIRVN